VSPDEIVYQRWVNEVVRIVAEDKQRISTVFNRMSKNKDVMTRDEFAAGVGVLHLRVRGCRGWEGVNECV
jgi:hypothetical protein